MQVAEELWGPVAIREKLLSILFRKTVLRVPQPWNVHNVLHSIQKLPLSSLRVDV